MENSDGIRNEIYNTMQLKTNDELVFILEENDHEEWTDTAFEVVKKILIERTGRLPELPVKTIESTEWATIDWQVTCCCFDVKNIADGPRLISPHPLCFYSVLLYSTIMFW